MIQPGSGKGISPTSCYIQDVDLATDIKRIRFLVVDEADRMIETGHFAELEQIVALTERKQEAM